MKNKIRNIYNNITQRRFFPAAIKFFVWVTMVLFWWVVLTYTIDMPKEHKLRHSTDALKREYSAMSERYDSLARIIDNVVRRDENVFRKLFESNPYDLSADLENERISLHEQLMQMSNTRCFHIWLVGKDVGWQKWTVDCHLQLTRADISPFFQLLSIF